MLEYRFGVSAPVPVSQNHGYHLLAALARQFPFIHGRESVQISPMGGIRDKVNPDLIHLGPTSVLRVRGISEAEALQMSNTQINLDGVPVTTSVARAYTLRPSPQVSSRIVVYKDAVTPTEFLAALVKQIQTVHLEGEVSVSLGRRRALSIKGHKMLGYSVTLTDLSPEVSLGIQSQGLGWGRSMGCGVFGAPPKA